MEVKAQIDGVTKSVILKKIINVLLNNGEFIQYQYSLLDYSFLKNNFRITKISFTFFNRTRVIRKCKIAWTINGCNSKIG